MDREDNQPLATKPTVSAPVSEAVNVRLSAIITSIGWVQALKAVRRVTDEKAAVVAAERRLGAELLAHEVQKEKWANRDDMLAAVRLKSASDLRQAEADAKRAEVSFRLAQKELDDIAILEEIEAEERQFRLIEARRRTAAAQAALDGLTKQGGDSGSRLQAELKRKREEYDLLLKEKTADIERYGGEENLPDFLKALYDKALDNLGF